jgi:wyosine [tRNA(Phe)-imidazoG37] synthetase (radical SAM superfamily)
VTNKTVKRDVYMPVEPIIGEIRDFLAQMETPVDYITFSGSGEPTLHSQIGVLIREIKKMTSIPVAVITNGSLLFMDEVKRDLGQADLVVPSLDAVTKTVYETVNRPEESLEINRVIQGIADFRAHFPGQVWIEILFCRGINDDPSEIERMKRVLDEISPHRIQLNTVYGINRNALSGQQIPSGEGRGSDTDYRCPEEKAAYRRRYGGGPGTSPTRGYQACQGIAR